MRRALAIFVAFVVEWIVYMIAMMMTVYDGIISMIFQPIMAVLCSGSFLALALLVGLILRIPVISRWWRSSRLWALTLVLGSLFILCFGSFLESRRFTPTMKPGVSSRGSILQRPWVATLR